MGMPFSELASQQPDLHGRFAKLRIFAAKKLSGRRKPS